MPYGELIQYHDQVKKITEKPSIYHLVNAGVYVVNKALIKNFKKIKN